VSLLKISMLQWALRNKFRSPALVSRSVAGTRVANSGRLF
jgi:hypothetical protein